MVDKVGERQMLGRFRVGLRFLDPQSVDRVLSVGCKEAELESFLVGRVASITATDIDRGILKSAQERFREIDFEYGDVVAGLNYESGSFEKVLFLEVLEHLPPGTEPDALAELHRVMIPGGALVLSTPNHNLFTTTFDPAYWLIGHRHYRRSRVEELLRDAGFEIEECFVGGGIVEMLWLPVFYLLLRLRLARFIKPSMDRLIDREYLRPGYQTLLFKCRKPVTAAS